MSPELIEVKYALDTFYFLICGVLVMWMAAGFTMLESGLVRTKSTTEILTKNVALYSIACVMYLVMGYAIMYGGSTGGYLPDVWFGNIISNSSAEEVIASNGDTYYSGASDFFFQVVFVATAMSIVSGAVAERMKLWSFLLFAIILTGFIYPMQGMWKWGGGFLDAAGFQDFAGSGVVHLCGATAAIAGVILLGARKGKYTADGKVNAIPGSNLPLAAIGMFILWMGWFGFNGGSELKVSDVGEANAVADIFVNTNAAAAAGLLAALVTSQLLFNKADLTMAINGALAGLVAITAEPLAWTAGYASIIGAIGGVLVVFSILAMDKIKIDDPVGAISVHGVVGIWGLLAVCLSGNEDATLMGQLTGIVVILAWTFVTSMIAWFIIKSVIGIRVTEQAETDGVDASECGLAAYPEFTK
ncbi:ammonium transporter [Porticoccus sp.]|jgi:Amt family ammonium transporter|nr:ammonium transporter [Gammaproteobacteria bacterium]MCH9843136.1 ammonium transporter [Gammaproteobacteria bacterium]MDA7737565.1 ammonium transporter [Porticoccus sp.]MDC0888120.1 ammonium transporter [Porticoccus sp.]MDC1270665.1 ammonium transporter [Porticoccus sp.]